MVILPKAAVDVNAVARVLPDAKVKLPRILFSEAFMPRACSNVLIDPLYS